MSMHSALDQARDLFHDGLAHFEAGRFAQAEGCFTAALALAPGRPSLLTNVGVTRVRLGKAAEAIPVLRQAVAAEPNNLEAWAHLAQAHERLADLDEALACCDQALAIGPDRSSLWLQRGQLLVRLNRAEAALTAFDRAIEADPERADAWSHKGTLLREAQRPTDAAVCFQRALALGADPEVHRYFLASVAGGEAPATAPRQYVQFLFDDYASEFQDHLVGLLGYQGHTVLVEHLAQLAPRRFRSALDLGCGTGLCGPLVQPLVDRLDGVDLSGAMLDQARAVGVYTELVHADAVEHLVNTDRRYDLVLAADVFIYIGALANVFAGVARVLMPEGIFCFTVELLRGEGGMQLLPSLRYAHTESHVRQLAADHDFQVIGVHTAPLRQDQQRSVTGLYVVLAKADVNRLSWILGLDAVSQQKPSESKNPVTRDGSTVTG